MRVKGIINISVYDLDMSPSLKTNINTNNCVQLEERLILV